MSSDQSLEDLIEQSFKGGNAPQQVDLATIRQVGASRRRKRRLGIVGAASCLTAVGITLPLLHQTQQPPPRASASHSQTTAPGDQARFPIGPACLSHLLVTAKGRGLTQDAVLATSKVGETVDLQFVAVDPVDPVSYVRIAVVGEDADWSTTNLLAVATMGPTSNLNREVSLSFNAQEPGRYQVIVQARLTATCGGNAGINQSSTRLGYVVVE